MGGILLAAALLAASCVAQSAPEKPQLMPSGQLITPLAPAGAKFSKLNPGLKDFPDYTAGQAVKMGLSPDGNTLLILTSGYNRLNDAQGHRSAADSNEYVFVFDVSGGGLHQKQVLQVPNTFLGLAFAPDGKHFFVSGGMDDNVHVFAENGGEWAESGAPIALGHPSGAGYHQHAMVANLAVTADGRFLVAANIADDSISILDLDQMARVAELNLRPSGIAPGAPADNGVHTAAENGAVSPGAETNSAAHGQAPYGVAIKGSTTAYVSSESDREIEVVDLTDPHAPRLAARIPVPGNPTDLLLNREQTKLFVSADNSDTISVIDTRTNRVIETIRTTAPAGLLRRATQLPGAAPNGIALSPDERTLYVTNGGMNAIAVISLVPGQPHRVKGLIPTGWYPQSISLSRDGKTIYDVNSKSDPGPNVHYTGTGLPRSLYLRGAASNQYILQLEKAGLQAVPVPNAKELAWLTRRVAENDFLNTAPNPHDEFVMAALRKHIRHVIYIIKENRTYDQVLGDLDRGNGDPSLAEFGQVITPNQHKLAQQFVDLDNILCSGEVSGNGWPWSTAARETDFNVKTVPLSYADRGSPPGDAAADGPAGEKDEGYIWDSALRHHLTIRNYGFEARFPEETRVVPDPYASRTVVDIPVWPHLVGVTDPYFWAFDNRFPDFRRELEWEREFDQYVANHNLPDLEFVRFMHDHEGDFKTAIDGINTPEKETADNDYAVGKLIEKIAHSPYASSTLIFIIEDDAQAGADHVDAHRTIAFVVGPYVKQGAVVDERYSTVNMVRTIEDVLGLGHLNLNDEYQRPMTAVFDLKQSSWNYTATMPAPVAKEIAAALGKSAPDVSFHDSHPAAFWAQQTRGFDWSKEDHVPALLFNQILWKGLTGGAPYPAARSGEDFSQNRQAVLAERSRHFLYQQP
ncbi:MAG TPA: beta-propeller fold lactonase family protein [Terracidiphilus sp.]|nr:beta-propeller fold lactonase family protein [Terracidiphilus sp.]